MTRIVRFVAILSLAGCASVGPGAGVQRMYVMTCGENRTNDVAPW